MDIEDNYSCDNIYDIWDNITHFNNRHHLLANCGNKLTMFYSAPIDKFNSQEAINNHVRNSIINSLDMEMYSQKWINKTFNNYTVNILPNEVLVLPRLKYMYRQNFSLFPIINYTNSELQKWEDVLNNSNNGILVDHGRVSYDVKNMQTSLLGNQILSKKDFLDSAPIKLKYNLINTIILKETMIGKGNRIFFIDSNDRNLYLNNILILENEQDAYNLSVNNLFTIFEPEYDTVIQNFRIVESSEKSRIYTTKWMFGDNNPYIYDAAWALSGYLNYPPTTIVNGKNIIKFKTCPICGAKFREYPYNQTQILCRPNCLDLYYIPEEVVMRNQLLRSYYEKYCYNEPDYERLDIFSGNIINYNPNQIKEFKDIKTREALIKQLQLFDFNISHFCSHYGISRPTLYNRLSIFGIPNKYVFDPSKKYLNMLINLSNNSTLKYYKITADFLSHIFRINVRTIYRWLAKNNIYYINEKTGSLDRHWKK